jgi:nucleotide-binding universal stress UspA family protein
MKILVAVDPSDSAHLAVTKAAEMAKLGGSQLTLLAVAETFQDMESLFGQDATDRMKERASKALDAAKAMASAAGAKPKLLLKTGVSPEGIIVDAAEKGGFDLIVMGTRSKKGKTGLRMGSVASKVVNLAPCSVLVVR